MKVKNMTKEEALAENYGIGLEPDEVEVSSYDDCLFEFGSNEYLVLTDDEADQRCADYIRESVWAFNASFLQDYMPLNEEQINDLRGDKCESINEAFLALISDEGDFIDDAIAADGRGHFLSGYDGEESKVGEYFIYQTN